MPKEIATGNVTIESCEDSETRYIEMPDKRLIVRDNYKYIGEYDPNLKEVLE